MYMETTQMLPICAATTENSLKLGRDRGEKEMACLMSIATPPYPSGLSSLIQENPWILKIEPGFSQVSESVNKHTLCLFIK